MEPVQQLKDLLVKSRSHVPDGEFCGIGVVVYANLTTLPVAALCSTVKIPETKDLAEQIALCSIGSSPCHDGFQFVSKNWQLTRRNQYFAPFPKTAKIELEKFTNNVGSRYMAAKLGSLLDQVICTGVISIGDGLIVFRNGEVV